MPETIDQAVPPSLREAIAADLSPVTPLAGPWRRTLPVVPIAVVLLVGSAAAFRLRVDAPALGAALTWGASSLQMAIGLALVAAALREAVPGTTLTRRALGIAVATGAIAVLTITWLTWLWSPVPARPIFGGVVWRICLAGPIVSALPALALSGWLVARAFPLRPRIAGALYGLGAGLLSDAGWRLFCHFPGPAHVLGAHALGIVAVTLLGMALASTLAQRPE
ncbi:MAG: NrsF family protein [Vicinamibacterales bacterium]